MKSDMPLPQEDSFSISLALTLGHTLKCVFSLLVIGGSYMLTLRSLKLQKRSLMLRIYIGKSVPGEPQCRKEMSQK